METDSDWTSYAAGGDRQALWAEVKLWELDERVPSRLAPRHDPRSIVAPLQARIRHLVQRA
jgi:hypothetical protein